jgi:hypothetical protein
MYVDDLFLNLMWQLANAIDLKKIRHKRISGNVAMQTTVADKG